MNISDRVEETRMAGIRNKLIDTALGVLKPGKKLITTPRKRYPKPEEKITLEEFYEKEGM